MAKKACNKKVQNVLRYLKEKWTKRNKENYRAIYFSFTVMAFVFVFSLHWIFSSKEDIFDLMKENMLDLEFSGRFLGIFRYTKGHIGIKMKLFWTYFQIGFGRLAKLII